MAVTSAILTTWVFLLTCHVASVCGMPGRLCYSCEKVSSAQDCDTIVRCAEDEVCFSQRFLEGNLREYYRMGCRAPDVCKQDTVDLFGFGASGIGKRQYPEMSAAHALSPRAAPTEMALCFQCCNADECNNNLCGSTPSSLLRCFECLPAVDSPHDCGKVTECQPHHSCYVHLGKVHSNSRFSFQLGCMSELQCRGASVAYNNIGCFACCKDRDYCNFNACDHFKLNISSTTQIPTMAATTTTMAATTAPEVSISPKQNVSVPYMSPFTAHCSSGVGNNITWAMQGGEPLPPGVHAYSGGSLVFDKVNENNTGVYRCVAVGPTGLVTSKKINIKIIPVPAAVLYIEKIPVGYIQDGGPFALKCHVIGYPLPNVTWSFLDTHGGNTVPSSVGYHDHEHTLTFDHFDHQHNDGQWTCAAKNQYGSGVGHETLS